MAVIAVEKSWKERQSVGCGKGYITGVDYSCGSKQLLQWGFGPLRCAHLRTTFTAIPTRRGGVLVGEQKKSLHPVREDYRCKLIGFQKGPWCARSGFAFEQDTFTSFIEANISFPLGRGSRDRDEPSSGGRIGLLVSYGLGGSRRRRRRRRGAARRSSPAGSCSAIVAGGELLGGASGAVGLLGSSGGEQIGETARPHALDTLAQLDQSQNTPHFSSKNGVSRKGGGVPSPMGILQKRARAKLLSRALSARLAGLGSPLEKSYWNTYHCASVIVQEGGKLETRYCGNRWCLVCSRVRTARAIGAYMPILSGWGDPHLVTLTVRNCSAEELPGTIDTMMQKFTSCKRSMVRTHGFEVMAVRKLECTYNTGRNDYHPHFHILINGRQQAELLRELWLSRFPTRAEASGQDVRPADAGSLMELFKYFCKLMTRTGAKGERGMIPAGALDTIFRAMRGRRVWQPVGFKLSREEEEAIEGDELEVTGTAAWKRLDERVYWQWDQDVADWIDGETGETLSEYEPGERYRSLVAGVDGQHNGGAITDSQGARVPSDRSGGDGGGGVPSAELSEDVAGGMTVHVVRGSTRAPAGVIERGGCKVIYTIGAGSAGSWPRRAGPS